MRSLNKADMRHQISFIEGNLRSFPLRYFSMHLYGNDCKLIYNKFLYPKGIFFIFFSQYFLKYILTNYEAAAAATGVKLN